jgi:iron complex transport system ATP-binding protein
MVLVTHHLEEIPPGFTHALVLKNGQVSASGALSETVTSEVLSDAFDLNLDVDQRDGRFTARLRDS